MKGRTPKRPSYHWQWQFSVGEKSFKECSHCLPLEPRSLGLRLVHFDIKRGRTFG